MFLRKGKAREPVPVTMSGVRMGERLLQVGIDDPGTLGAIAGKVGLSGTAAVAVTDDQGAERARKAAAEAGILMDIRVQPLDALPWDEAAFDAVVVHAMRGLDGALGSSAGALAACHRVLRPGGRLIVIEQGARTGLAALLRGGGAAADAGADVAVQRLGAAGFRPVRLIGELEGYRFTEGLRPSAK